MSARWEYITVRWVHSTNYASKAPDEPQTWETKYVVSRAGSEPEELPSDLNWVEFLNRLGGEGWELVSESIRNTVVYGQAQGWTSVGSPVLMVWTFKRPAH